VIIRRVSLKADAGLTSNIDRVTGLRKILINPPVTVASPENRIWDDPEKEGRTSGSVPQPATAMPLHRAVSRPGLRERYGVL
jgi:hypothetical protein